MLVSCRKAVVRLPVWTEFLLSPLTSTSVLECPTSCPVEGSFIRVKLLEREAVYTSLHSDPVHVCLELHLQSQYFRFHGVFRRVRIKLKFSTTRAAFKITHAFHLCPTVAWDITVLTVQHVMCTPRIFLLILFLSSYNVIINTSLLDIMKLHFIILSPKFTFSEELKVIDMYRWCSDIFT